MEEFAGVIELAGFFEEAFDDEALVIKRQLDGDFGELGVFDRRGDGQVLAELAVCAHGGVAVQAIDGENAEDAEVGDEERPIEGREAIDAGEGVVE